MINIEDKLNCCGCHACYNICPKKAIGMKEDEKGFKYPYINKSKCINCGLCEKVCPIINTRRKEYNIKAYACYNKNENIRLDSSSGGIFNLLAEKILKKDGIVFGAKFDKEFNVIHSYIYKVEDLENFRKSKYVQSTIGDTYKEAKEFLDNGKFVLFTGTPCQIEGLKCYLQKDYDNLHTQDIICHGVPSPKVWKKYLEYRKSQDLEEPKQINFRQKDNGWNLYALFLQYNNNTYKTSHEKDLFMRTFLKDASLRDSCYSCSFKQKIRNSDITLADFWGIKNILPDMNDNKGISLVIVNSDKGRELFDSINENIECREVIPEEAMMYNKSIIQSATMHKNRDEFFDNLDNMNFDKLVKKYIPKENIINKIIRKAKKLIYINN